MVLAAGASRRMGDEHKLLAELDGRPLVTRSVEAAMAAGLDPVVVVVGHRADEVAAVLPAGATVVRNPDHGLGLSASLAAGLAALPEDVSAAAVALGDMPFVEARHYRALVEAWRPGAIVAPTREGRPGHPVLWPARFFAEMSALTGDRGARALMEAHRSALVEVPVEDEAIHADIDDARDLERARRRG